MASMAVTDEALRAENQQLRQRLAAAEDRLHRHDAILDVVGEAARLFLEGGDPYEHVQAVLDLLGQATDVSRCYIFENQYTPDDMLQMCQRYEWAAPGVEPQIDSPDLQQLAYQDVGFLRWVEVLGNGAPIYGHVGDFPPDERAILEPQNVVAIAVIPIFVGHVWWGFIGFDDCVTNRDWSLVEIQALETIAGMFGSALYNYQSVQKRIKVQEQIVRVQEAMLRELSTPLIPISERVLALPLIGTVDQRRAQMMLATLLDGVAAQQAQIVIIDITGVSTIDSYVASTLIQAARAIRLLGAQVILTGIGPAAAQALVHIGVCFDNIVTRGTLQEGIAYALHRS
jgi:anti-anti-sigma regulatory factor